VIRATALIDYSQSAGRAWPVTKSSSYSNAVAFRFEACLAPGTGCGLVP
jgi:hypothetical protein